MWSIDMHTNTTRNVDFIINFNLRGEHWVLEEIRKKVERIIRRRTVAVDVANSFEMVGMLIEGAQSTS
jgi:hypothetical protein